MLHVQHLSVWYDVTEVLRDVSFSVNERSVVALLGGNGSGKSTLLNALSGLVAPRSGSVRYLGEETAGLGAHVMVRRGIVQVPQGREIFADMSVGDNLELGAASRSNLKEIRKDMVEVFDLFPALRERRTRRSRQPERRRADTAFDRSCADVTREALVDGRAVGGALATHGGRCRRRHSAAARPWPHHSSGGAECRRCRGRGRGGACTEGRRDCHTRAAPRT